MLSDDRLKKLAKQRGYGADWYQQPETFQKLLRRVAREAAEDERKRLGEVVIDHCLRGKDHTAAGYYTAITGIRVQGVVLDDGQPVVLFPQKLQEGE